MSKPAKAVEPTITRDLTPERTDCPHCGGPMRADYANRRTVHTLAELRQRLGLEVSLSTLYEYLRRIEFSFKKTRPANVTGSGADVPIGFGSPQEAGP